MSILNRLTSFFNRDSTLELNSISTSVDNQLSIVSSDLDLLDAQFIISTSTGTWLDEYGSWFGVIRMLNETDINYRMDILNTVHTLKNTLLAIQTCVANYLNSTTSSSFLPSDIKLIEPYKYLILYGVQGLYDDIYRYPDGTYWRKNTLNIILQNAPSQGLIDAMNHIRTYGVSIIWSTTSPSGL